MDTWTKDDDPISFGTPGPLLARKMLAMEDARGPREILAYLYARDPSRWKMLGLLPSSYIAPTIFGHLWPSSREHNHAWACAHSESLA